MMCTDSSVSQVSDPSTVVTTAAYLLFYRRRSKGPLGGPRFTEIFEKFDNPNDDEDSATEVGDDQRSEDSFGRGTVFGAGLSSHNETTTTIRPLASSDDEALPSYGHSTVHPSIEDEGVEMPDDPYLALGPNPVTQAWSFGESGNNGVDGSDCASDTVQVSSEDERGPFDQDIEMNSVAGDHSDGEDRGLISVPTKTRGDRDSEEVTEIHVEGDKDARAE